MMKARTLRTAGFSLAFSLALFAPAHAQAAARGAPSEAPSPLSAIAHDFTTWLNHVAGNGANNSRAGRHGSPSPRPAAALASTPAAPNKQWSEFITPPGASKKTTPVQIND
jgi:hypothetical protein